MLKFYKKFDWLIILILISWCFLLPFQELIYIYSRPWFWQNAIVAILIFLLFVTNVWHKKMWRAKEEFPGLLLCLSLFVICLLLITNNYLGSFQIVMPILGLLVIYWFLGWFLKPEFWYKSSVVFMMLILTLPILERLQKFIGIPLRFYTAQIVSWLLRLLGVSHASQSTVIMTENYATSIDLPCSGVKSLYYGLIILLVIFFLQKIKLSAKAFFVSFIFFALLIFFNIWRVFGLVYIYGILNLVNIGNQIHVLLGVVGFGLSILFLWKLSTYLACTSGTSKPSEKISGKLWLKSIDRPFTLLICVGILILTITLNYSIFSFRHRSDSQVAGDDQQSLANDFIAPYLQAEIPLSLVEKNLYNDQTIKFAAKYHLEWNGIQSSLLLVKSSSARTHHDPEICLQSLGYQIIDSTSFTLSSSQNVSQLTVHGGPKISGQPQSGQVYYWYLSRNQILTDYSSRVWNEFKEPQQSFVLVELAFLETEKISHEELHELFNQLNEAIRNQLLQ